MADDKTQTVGGRFGFSVLVTVIALIAVVLIAQRIPHAVRPTLHPAVTTEVTEPSPVIPTTG